MHAKYITKSELIGIISCVPTYFMFGMNLFQFFWNLYHNKVLILTKFQRVHMGTKDISGTIPGVSTRHLQQHFV